MRVKVALTFEFDAQATSWVEHFMALMHQAAIDGVDAAYLTEMSATCSTSLHDTNNNWIDQTSF